MLFCFGSALLLASCGAPPPDSTTNPGTPASQTSSEMVGSQLESPEGVVTDAPPVATSKPLDLTRSSSFDEMIDSAYINTDDQDDLLPDLFADQGREAKTRASGRLIMSEEEKALTESVEGVELKLEVPVN